MAYKELKSLYYGTDEAYAQEYLNRFNSPEAIKLNFYIGKSQAFFLQNTEVLMLAYRIAKLDKAISKLCDDLPGVAINQYSKKCLIDEIVITNKIEGVRSTRKEIGDALVVLETQSSQKGKRQRFLGLVNKYFKLMQYEQVSLKSCKDIRDIYDEVFLEEVVFEDPANAPDGTLFRKNPVSIRSAADRKIHEGLMPETRIIEAMEQALSFLNEESVDGLFRACIFHYLIEYIHPFYDGNGRLGRFILSCGIANELSPLISFRISETIKEKINTYYKAFKICNDHRNQGDLTPFLLMQLDMILNAMQDLEKSLLEKLTTWNKYERIIERHFRRTDLLTLSSYLIQAALFSERGISMQELQQNMKYSPYMIKKLMEKIPVNLVVIKKKGNFKFYSFNLEELDSIALQESIKRLES